MTLDAEVARAEAILPRKTIVELAKLLTDSDDTVSIELLPNQALCLWRQSVIVSKVVDGKFPDYNRVIPLITTKSFLINRQPLFWRCNAQRFWPMKIPWRAPDPGLGQPVDQCTNSEQEEAEEELKSPTGAPLEIGFQHQLPDRCADQSASGHAATGVWRRQPQRAGSPLPSRRISNTS